MSIGDIDMKKKVLRKMSNPKKTEEYLKMFEKYLKFQSQLKGASAFLLGVDKGSVVNIIIDSMTLAKNDRIESFLKYYRVYLCNRFLKLYDKDDMEEFKQYCQKEVISYTEKTLLSLNEIIPETLDIEILLASLKHFIDLYNSDKTLYKKINDYSWTNKSVFKVSVDLTEIELELRDSKKFAKAEYERRLLDAEPTKEYLKIDDKYTWYIIESNRCRFEAYLNDHCGTDSSADVLFSLRSKNPEGFFNSHVTISAKIEKVDKKKFSTPAVFVVGQVKGKANDKPNERYWDAIVKLFLEDEFGWQVRGAYRADSDFHISDLDDKEKNKFLKIKPWWDNVLEALIHYDKLKDTKAFTAEYWEAKKADFDNEGTFVITYHSFGEMVEMLEKKWGRDVRKGREYNARLENIITQAKYYTDDFYPDVDFSWEDIWFDDFMLWIKNKYKKKYNKINECLEAEGMSEVKELWQYDFDTFKVLEEGCQSYLFQVKNAFENAYRTGLEIGGQSAAYEAFKYYFDDHEITYNGSHMGNFKLKNDGTFQVRIFQEAINEYYGEYEELGIPRPDSDSLEPPHRGIEWSGNFDDEAASERLFEELPD